MEADYILSCQFLGSSGNAYGAINNVYGDPTWVVPGENAIAIMGLAAASDLLGNNIYRDRAGLSANYLMRMQDNGDGAWYDHYNYSVPETNAGKSLRHTAEVIIAYDKLGYDSSRYDSMKKGAQFILDCQDVSNKGGIDDGLVCGGKDYLGNYHTWRWTSDNAFAYQALRTTAAWARVCGENNYAQTLDDAAGRILQGLGNNIDVSGDHWVRVVDADGNVVPSENYSDWISYAPAMLDVPSGSIDYADVGDWIHDTLQKSDGALVWDDVEFSDRKSPGFSFQAMLVWLDMAQGDYADAALLWAENSSLWQQIPDDKGVTGGWIDWIEGYQTAPQWQRFIDTSAYYIMVRNGGYDFNAVVPEPSTILLFLSGLFGCFWFRKSSRIR